MGVAAQGIRIMSPQLASIAFKGGSVVLSAQTPYDCELVAEYVRDCARAKEGVRLTFGRDTWRVEHVGKGHQLVCSQCQRPFRGARCYGSCSRTEQCVLCALRETPHRPLASPSSATVH